tara:strand:+ start:8061 stop:8645 length:585 start_codon:yes stop_codon:yes gene_type:complete
MNIPKYYGYKYYVGDPCYVIDDNRWEEFCTALWDGEKENKDNGCPEYPVYIEWGIDGIIYNIEVWNSPNGDGVWNFSNTVKEMRGWIAGTEMGVDAGLLAIVPYGAISNNSTCSDKDSIKEISNLGIIFTEEPTLETGIHVVGEVTLNYNDENNVYYCYNCGEHTYEHDVIDCENYNCMGCYTCFECECEDEEE